MTRLPMLKVLAVIACLSVSGGTLYGQQEASQEGLLQRINPFRLLRNRERTGLATHSQSEKSPRSLQQRGVHSPVADSGIARQGMQRQQAEYRSRFGTSEDGSGDAETLPLRPRFAEDSRLTAASEQRLERNQYGADNGGWFGQRTEEGRPPTIEDMRAHLLARGVDPAIVERQMQRLGTPQGRERAELRPGAVAGEPELEQIRAELQTRGIDTRAVDGELAREANMRAFNQRFQNRTLANGAPDYQQLRSRTSRSGADPRSLNARLGRAVGVEGGAENSSRNGSARVRRR